MLYYRGKEHIYCYDISEKVKELGSVVISNNDIFLNTNQSKDINIIIYDQYFVAYDSAVTVQWSINGAGSVDQNGKYTAPSYGGVVDTVIVSVSEPGKEVKDTAYVTVKQPQHISCPQLDSVYYLQEPFRLACNASSGLPVVYEEVSGPFNLSGDTVNLLGVAGTAYISVTQPGNEIYDAAPSVMYTFIISYTEPDDTIPEVSVEEVQDNKVDVYPNPTNGVITIVSAQSLNVKVFNMLGNEIINREIFNTFKGRKEVTIDLTNQPDGLYIVKMDNEVVKVLKQ